MQNSISFYLRKPKYWLGLAFFALVRSIVYLPVGAQVGLGRAIGRGLYLIASRRRNIAKTNLNLCFPELTEQQRKQLLKENFALTGLALIETLACWFSELSARDHNTQITGKEHLNQAIEQGKGVILLSFHMTSLEVGASILGKHFPICGMYKPNKNQLIDDVMYTGRLRHLGPLIAQDDVRSALKALKQNKILWYAADQNYGTKSTIFVPFFGTMASTITATSKFAKMTGAKVIPFTQKRNPDGKGYQLTIHPALENFPGTSEADDAIRINQFLEDYLKQYPADYMWLHQRFRTRPEGEALIYPKRIKKRDKKRNNKP